MTQRRHTICPGQPAGFAASLTDLRRIAAVMFDKRVDGAAADPIVMDRHVGSVLAERLPGSATRKALHRASRNGVRVA